ncbi:hypothetical protein [Streptomyces sp. NBC_00059]|uniref:DUF6959 family protein n=1 Tax=Streptomyces sp. NBC_00059 TaxID=2975635 RepID=UPI00225A9E30|nr:hypothetical protein [Streptomyces sp. NBC_00059]MCX5417293.1 hypothetical protein [Streptomyces sp. NBC_00059]
MTERDVSAAVLAVAGNYAVVQLEGRRHPALAVQGDSLNILYGVIEELAENLESGDLDEAGFSLREIRSTVSSMVSAYEVASAEIGFDLPYAR